MNLEEEKKTSPNQKGEEFVGKGEGPTKSLEWMPRDEGSQIGKTGSAPRGVRIKRGEKEKRKTGKKGGGGKGKQKNLLEKKYRVFLEQQSLIWKGDEFKTKKKYEKGRLSGKYPRGMHQMPGWLNFTK